MFVCLSTRVSQKQHVQILPHFLYVLPVAVARSSSDDNITGLKTSGFVDDVAFSRNGARGPKSCTNDVIFFKFTRCEQQRGRRLISTTPLFTYCRSYHPSTLRRTVK